MKHRERVQMALSHEEPDRCPMQISFTPEFADRLRAEIQAGGDEGRITRTAAATPTSWSAAWTRTCCSPRWAGRTPTTSSPATISMSGALAGIHRRTPRPSARATIPRWSAIPWPTTAAIAGYRPPDPNRPELYDEAERVLRDYKDEYWIVGVTVTTIFETAWALRGYERIADRFRSATPTVAEAHPGHPLPLPPGRRPRLVEMGVDMIWIGDDVGAQKAMIISPGHVAQIPQAAHGELHCRAQGDQPPAQGRLSLRRRHLPDHPRADRDRPGCAQPDPARLHGPGEAQAAITATACASGARSTSSTPCPLARPEDVRQEVLQRLKTLGKGGGLILGPPTTSSLDTPMENFWAMQRTITGTPYATLR